MEDFKEFLLRWVDWRYSDRSLNGLGMAQGGYAERTGHSPSTADPLRHYEPEIQDWDAFFSTELPRPIHEPIRLAYLVPGPEKRKYAGSNSRDYYRRLDFARETALAMFNRHMMRKASAQEKAAAS